MKEPRPTTISARPFDTGRALRSSETAAPGPIALENRTALVRRMRACAPPPPRGSHRASRGTHCDVLPIPNERSTPPDQRVRSARQVAHRSDGLMAGWLHRVPPRSYQCDFTLSSLRATALPARARSASWRSRPGAQIEHVTWSPSSHASSRARVERVGPRARRASTIAETE